MKMVISKTLIICASVYFCIYNQKLLCMDHHSTDQARKISISGANEQALMRIKLFHAIGNVQYEKVQKIVRNHPKVVNTCGPCPIYGDMIPALHYLFRPILHDGNGGLLKMLLKAGANPNAIDVNGNTIVHLPRIYMYENHLAYLLQYGFDIDKKNAKGRTALMEHIRNVPDSDIVEDIMMCSGNINVQDNDGKTALHHALEIGLFGIAALLRDNTDADFTIADNQGKKPIDILSADKSQGDGFFYGDYNDWYGTKQLDQSSLFGANGYKIKELLYKHNNKNYEEFHRIHNYLQAMPIKRFLKKIELLDGYEKSLFYSLRSGKGFSFIVEKEKRRRKIKQAMAIKEYIIEASVFAEYECAMSKVE